MVHFILKQNAVEQVSKVSAMVLTSFLVLGLGLTAEANGRYQTEAQGVEACTACLQAPGFQTPKLEVIPGGALRSETGIAALPANVPDTRVPLSRDAGETDYRNGAVRVYNPVGGKIGIAKSSGQFISPCHILVAKHGVRGREHFNSSGSEKFIAEMEYVELKKIQISAGKKPNVADLPKATRTNYKEEDAYFEFPKVDAKLVAYGTREEWQTNGMEDFALLKVTKKFTDRKDGKQKQLGDIVGWAPVWGISSKKQPMAEVGYFNEPANETGSLDFCKEFEVYGFPGDRAITSVWGERKVIRKYEDGNSYEVSAFASPITGGTSGGPLLCDVGGEMKVFGLANFSYKDENYSGGATAAVFSRVLFDYVRDDAGNFKCEDDNNPPVPLPI